MLAGLAGAPVRAQQPAGAPARASFAIPPQPLAAALRQFVRQSGVQVAFATPDGQNVASPGVSGSFTPADALMRLLAGTGLTYHFTGANTATLERLPPGSAVLGPCRSRARRRRPMARASAMSPG
jgi:hypothetical protein